MADQGFPWRKMFILGFGFFGINTIWPLFNSLIPFMLADLGLTATVIGFIMTWDNIINLFLQPWVGGLSDRTRTRFGRRKPWLMVGAPLAALFFFLVPFVRGDFALIALAILGTSLGMALFRSPTVAYLGDLVRPAERSKSSGVFGLMGSLGGASALLGGGALYKIGAPLPFIVGAGVMLIATGIVVAFVREPGSSPASTAEREPGIWVKIKKVATDSDRSGLLLLTAVFSWFVGCNTILTFFALYARNVLGVPAGTGVQMLTAFPAAVIVFSIPSGLLATRIGRKPTIVIGLGGMALSSLAGFTVGNPTASLAVLAVMGAFWALVSINALPLVYDLSGEHSIGASTGLFFFSASLAAITGPILVGRLIDATSYRIIWALCLVFFALAMVLMTQVRPRRATLSPLR